ncbi:MAG: histidine phosphatase family protein [Lachnospiraceae bacterium]|nr:histidine phosphatase family protein [Lachnospiraceae bacterium]
MRLILIRHGEPDYDNDCLTKTGHSQAEKTAERLEKEHISRIFASPMGRAMETAQYTADTLGLPINKLDFMHEIDWGFGENNPIHNQNELQSEGHPWSLSYRLLTENPEYVGSDKWDGHPFFRDNACLKDYRRVAAEFDGFLEQLGLIRKDGLYFCKEENEETIAIFAHGGSGAVMLAELFSLPFPFVLTSLPYGLCSVSIVSFYAKSGEMVIPCMELFNDMGHI